METMQNEAESNLIKAVGKGVWAGLEEKAREEFKKGEFEYIVAGTIEGEGGNFKAFVSCYSNGLLFEIQRSLRGPLERDPSLGAEYKEIFGKDKAPEWGKVIQFIETLEQRANTKYAKSLMPQKVPLQRVGTLLVPFRLMQTARNDAAHMVLIDRERATILHHRLLNPNGGLIRQVVEIFKKPRDL
jgi:hypothetical protein